MKCNKWVSRTNVSRTLHPPANYFWLSVTIFVSTVQGHSRSLTFAQKPIYDFLLVINGNPSFISHHFQDIAMQSPNHPPYPSFSTYRSSLKENAFWHILNATEEPFFFSHLEQGRCFLGGNCPCPNVEPPLVNVE